MHIEEMPSDAHIRPKDHFFWTTVPWLWGRFVFAAAQLYTIFKSLGNMHCVFCTFSSAVSSLRLAALSRLLVHWVRKWYMNS